MTLSLEQLLHIMPHCPIHRGGQMFPHLVAAMQEADITTPARAAAFLAQLAHESMEFRFMEELASGKDYEGRSDLGNNQPGDGVRYKGRGPIQLTGRRNYRLAGRDLGLDLESHPERVADPDVGFRAACWFWTTHGLNALADLGDFDLITRRVNGGLNGKERRDAYHARAREILGA